MTMTDNVRDILRAFMRTFVRVHVPHHAVAARVHGAGVAEELPRHGDTPSPGRLYPLPYRLAQDGLLLSAARTVAGKLRRCGVATDRGRDALAELQPRPAEAVGQALPPRHTDAPTRIRRPSPQR